MHLILLLQFLPQSTNCTSSFVRISRVLSISSINLGRCLIPSLCYPSLWAKWLVPIQSEGSLSIVAQQQSMGDTDMLSFGWVCRFLRPQNILDSSPLLLIIGSSRQVILNIWSLGRADILSAVAQWWCQTAKYDARLQLTLSILLSLRISSIARRCLCSPVL